jgi:hypothetical protein
MGPQLQQQRDLFNAFTPVIDKFTAAVRPLIDTFTFITGIMRGALIQNLNAINFDNLKAAIPAISQGFINIFHALGLIKDIVKVAFHNIFPPGTESIIVKMADGFQRFTAALVPGVAATIKIRNVFMGLFSILSIGWEIIKEGAKFLNDLAQALFRLFGGGEGISSAFNKLGVALQHLKLRLVDGGAIVRFFENLRDVLQKPIEFLKKAKDAIGTLFDGFKSEVADKVGDGVGRISDRFGTLRDVFDRLSDIWKPLEDALGKVVAVLDAVWIVISDWFKELGHKMADALKPGDFNALLDVINVGLLGGIVVLLRKFFNEGFKLDLGGGFFEKISGVLDGLTSKLKAMQLQLKAEALMKIAEAIALLTASVFVLSMIDSVALSKALAAMAVGFGQLMGSFALFTKMASTPKSAATFAVLSTGLVILSSAILILSCRAFFRYYELGRAY